MATSPVTPAFHPPTGSAPDADCLIAEARLRARRRRRRNGAICVAALTVAGVLYAFWGTSSTLPPPGGDVLPAASPSQQQGAVQQASLGSPVRLDGMTFVVEKMAVATDADLASDRPLNEEIDDHGPWLLTVTVRNDLGIAQHDPFCHGVSHVGADIVTTHWEYPPWSDKSRSLHGNDALCSDIQPFATERFHLLFPLHATVRGVVLSHRARGSRDYARAYLEIHPPAPFVRQKFVDDRTS
ncbi:MAG TPA: hypothetical protein VFJ50_10785 [Gemmatimonadales bacterium]|nr:hypothetical protein [Gemmatimonadales bacterium]